MSPRRAEVLRVQIGEDFRPFEGKKVDLNKVSPDEGGIGDLVRRRINLGSTPGRIALTYDLANTGSYGELFPLRQPLGDVKFSFVYRKGKIFYEAVPLELQVAFWPTSMRQFHSLMQSQLEVDFGEEKFLMGFDRDKFSPDKLSNDQLAQRLKASNYKRGTINFLSNQLYTDNQQSVEVVLPSEAEKLSVINMRFIPHEPAPRLYAVK